jgi:hypothetical protein
MERSEGMFNADQDPDLWVSINGMCVLTAVGSVILGSLLLVAALSGQFGDLFFITWCGGPLLILGGSAFLVWWWNAPSE